MKTKTLAAVAIIALLLTGCAKNDAPETTAEDVATIQLEATWANLADDDRALLCRNAGTTMTWAELASSLSNGWKLDDPNPYTGRFVESFFKEKCK